MSEQTVSKSVHDIPEALVVGFEIIHKQKIVKVEFLKGYQDKDGFWEEFRVNEQFIFQVLNGQYGCITKIENGQTQPKDCMLVMV